LISRVQEHGGGQMIPFSCVLEKNLSDMPPDEAAKYCEANNVQRSVQCICLTAIKSWMWSYYANIFMDLKLIHQTLRSWVYVETFILIHFTHSKRFNFWTLIVTTIYAYFRSPAWTSQSDWPNKEPKYRTLNRFSPVSQVTGSSGSHELVKTCYSPNKPVSLLKNNIIN
jgi:hypothetical protein